MKTYRQDSVSIVMERRVKALENLSDSKYYDLLIRVDLFLSKITKRLFITRKLRTYDQRKRGEYGAYNWYLSLWGLEKTLKPSYILSKTIVIFVLSLILALSLSFISLGLFILVLVVGTLISRSYLQRPHNVVMSIRNTVLMYYPQCAIVFAARNTREMLDILEDIDVIGYEVMNLKSKFMRRELGAAATLEETVMEYLDRHPLQSMSLLKDMMMTFDIVNPELRKQRKLDIMRLFPFELTEFFDRVTEDYKNIQSFSLMFSEMIVFSAFMVLAIFGLIATPIALIIPAMMVIVSDTLFKSMLLNSISMRMFYSYRQSEMESIEKKNSLKSGLLLGFLVSLIFGFFTHSFTYLIVCVVIGTPALGYMFSSILGVIGVEQYTTPMYLHTLIREYISMVSAIKKETNNSSMIRAFVQGIEHGYYGNLRDVILPLLQKVKMGTKIDESLDEIYKKAFAESQIIKPYLFFMNKIIDVSTVKGDKTETKPAELFDVIFNISSQILRPLALRFESIIITGVDKATFTGVINGITTGIFVILGKVFQNILMKGFSNMGSLIDVSGTSTGGMSAWIYDFMTGMIGHLTGADLIAASLVSLSGTYLGVYAFQSNRTRAYIASVVSAVVTAYFGFILLEKMIGMMLNLM